MLENYIKEFLAVCDFCTKNEKKTLEFFLIEKSKIIIMLDQNKFDTATNKLKLWKGMNWTDTDDKKLTRRRYSKTEERYKTYVCIYRTVYETLLSKVSK